MSRAGDRILQSVRQARAYASGEVSEGFVVTGLNEWRLERDAPVGRWLRTRLEGEVGTNICYLRVSPDGEREWIALDGRTTVTHHSFLAPSHWQELEHETPDAR